MLRRGVDHDVLLGDEQRRRSEVDEVSLVREQFSGHTAMVFGRAPDVVDRLEPELGDAVEGRRGTVVAGLERSVQAWRIDGVQLGVAHDPDDFGPAGDDRPVGVAPVPVELLGGQIGATAKAEHELDHPVTVGHRCLLRQSDRASAWDVPSPDPAAEYADGPDFTDGAEAIDVSGIDLAGLTRPAALRALVVIAVCSLVLFWPERSTVILARLIGVGLAVGSAGSAIQALRSRPTAWLRFAAAVVLVAVGAFLVVSPDRSPQFLARVIASVILVVAARDLAGHRRNTRSADGAATGADSWPLARFVAFAAVAGLLFAFPDEVLGALVSFVSVGWIALSLLVLVVCLDEGRDEQASYLASGRIVSEWLAERPKSVDDRHQLYRKIVFDGASSLPRIVRFFVLMGFASVIASMGVITDSTAVVIGAMLIAPLMTPLMGMAVSLVMGWPQRLTNASIIAFGGIVFAISIGALLGLLAPAVIDTATNSQIVGRSSPTMLDLITAVAAGAAGAYGLSRPDVSDSLPGVAIAISLVPPLTVVGIAYSQGDWSAGSGALLLFATNMLAILVMGGLTFIVTGVAPLQRVADNQHRVRTSLAAIAAAAAIVTGLLLLNGSQIASTLLDESSIEAAVEQWIEDHPEHGVVRIVTDGDTVSVAVVGPAADAPSAADLLSTLEAEIDRSLTVDVRLIVEERDVATSSD